MEKISSTESIRNKVIQATYNWGKSRKLRINTMHRLIEFLIDAYKKNELFTIKELSEKYKVTRQVADVFVNHLVAYKVLTVDRIIAGIPLYKRNSNYGKLRLKAIADTLRIMVLEKTDVDTDVTKKVLNLKP